MCSLNSALFLLLYPYTYTRILCVIDFTTLINIKSLIEIQMGVWIDVCRAEQPGNPSLS